MRHIWVCQVSQMLHKTQNNNLMAPKRFNFMSELPKMTLQTGAQAGGPQNSVPVHKLSFWVLPCTVSVYLPHSVMAHSQVKQS